MPTYFRDLLRIIHPRMQGQLMTAIFKAYIDESSNEGTGGNTFAVGGFVGNANAWLQIEPKWLDALPDGIQFFHATECFGGRGQFKGMDIPDRIRLLDRLTDIILEHQLHMVCAGINVAAYKSVAPKARRNEFLTNKYVASFEQAIELVCASLYRNPPDWNIPVVNEKCAFIIEDSQQYGQTAREAFHHLKHFGQEWYRGMIGTDTWGNKEPGSAAEIPLLQLGDLAAFLGAKTIAKDPDGKMPWTPYFNKLVQSRRVFKLLGSALGSTEWYGLSWPKVPARSAQFLRRLKFDRLAISSFLRSKEGKR